MDEGHNSASQRSASQNTASSASGGNGTDNDTNTSVESPIPAAIEAQVREEALPLSEQFVKDGGLGGASPDFGKMQGLRLC